MGQGMCCYYYIFVILNCFNALTAREDLLVDVTSQRVCVVLIDELVRSSSLSLCRRHGGRHGTEAVEKLPGAGADTDMAETQRYEIPGLIWTGGHQVKEKCIDTKCSQTWPDMASTGFLVWLWRRGLRSRSGGNHPDPTKAPEQLMRQWTMLEETSGTSKWLLGRPQTNDGAAMDCTPSNCQRLPGACP